MKDEKDGACSTHGGRGENCVGIFDHLQDLVLGVKMILKFKYGRLFALINLSEDCGC